MQSVDMPRAFIATPQGSEKPVELFLVSKEVDAIFVSAIYDVRPGPPRSGRQVEFTCRREEFDAMSVGEFWRGVAEAFFGRVNA